MVIWGGAEGWQMAPELARAKVPVLLEPLTDVPRFDALNARLDNATLLWKAGVKVGGGATGCRLVQGSASGGGERGPERNELGRRAALDHAVDGGGGGRGDRYGSLEVGKVANVVVWTGDPLEFSSRVNHLFIRGKEIPLVSRQTELLDRYRSLATKVLKGRWAGLMPTSRAFGLLRLRGVYLDHALIADV